MPDDESASVSTRLARLIGAAIEGNGGWLPFDRFMALALYAPRLGYYANTSRKFGSLPASGSDFVTAPELSPLFGRALARQVRQALDATATTAVWEFGAGSGELAAQLLEALGDAVQRYTIVDLSGALRQRQRERLAPYGSKVDWVDELPATIAGVVIGNEVLDAMPVQLLHFDGIAWFERGVVVVEAAEAGTAQAEAPKAEAPKAEAPKAEHGRFAWADRPTALRPPSTDDFDRVFAPGTTTELHAQAEAFVATLAERLERGAAFFIDYGFPEAEYYHVQRSGGTVMCHRAHRVDTDPLVDVGTKDITAHVDFTGIALAAQQAGCAVVGYTSQARFLMNCGLVEMLRDADLRTTAAAQKLLTEHEMGELFKVLAFAQGGDFEPLGFAAGDRRHTL